MSYVKPVSHPFLSSCLLSQCWIAAEKVSPALTAYPMLWSKKKIFFLLIAKSYLLLFFRLVTTKAVAVLSHDSTF
jgi:hypothetical protein